MIEVKYTTKYPSFPWRWKVHFSGKTWVGVGIQNYFERPDQAKNKAVKFLREYFVCNETDRMTAPGNKLPGI
ncbi:MAG: hypothetical protein GY874_13840 [Desulfobacteraceae bacterium]|nr:hypothetical protein [Desulfobacteraceae bacterium]